MNYGESVQQVLIRKLNRVERELMQLKLDYCRFVYGLSHRTLVESGGKVYRVRGVDINSMQSLVNGELSRPSVTGVLADAPTSDPVSLGDNWVLSSRQAHAGGVLRNNASAASKSNRPTVRSA